MDENPYEPPQVPSESTDDPITADWVMTLWEYWTTVVLTVIVLLIGGVCWFLVFRHLWK